MKRGLALSGLRPITEKVTHELFVPERTLLTLPYASQHLLSDWLDDPDHSRRVETYDGWFVYTGYVREWTLLASLLGVR